MVHEDPGKDPTASDAAAVTTAAGALTDQVRSFNARLVLLRRLIAVMAVVVVVLVFALGGLGYLANRQQALAVCLAEQSRAFYNGAIQTRAASQKQSTEQSLKIDYELGMLDTILNPALAPEAKRAAVLTYRDHAQDLKTALADTRTAQDRNPIPNTVCQP